MLRKIIRKVKKKKTIVIRKYHLKTHLKHHGAKSKVK